MVKEFDLDPLSECWLVLDLNLKAQAGSGRDSTEELEVTVAATLASYYLGQNREVGLITQGHTIAADRGDRQLQKILELLAVLHAHSEETVQELVTSEERRFPRSAAAVIITSSSDESSLVAWQALEARGLSVAAVLLDVQSFGGGWTSFSLAGLLEARGIATYLIRRGDDVERVLEMPKGAGAWPA